MILSGVINLCVDKRSVSGKIIRDLKLGGRLQMADQAIGKGSRLVYSCHVCVHCCSALHRALRNQSVVGQDRDHGFQPGTS